MIDDLVEFVNEDTGMVVRSLNRLTTSGYDDSWIAEYLFRKTGQEVNPSYTKRYDFTLANGDKIGWRSWQWIIVKDRRHERSHD